MFGDIYYLTMIMNKDLNKMYLPVLCWYMLFHYENLISKKRYAWTLNLSKYYQCYDNKKEWIYYFAIIFSPFNTFRIDVLCSQINTLSVKRRDAFKIFIILTTCSCILHRWIEKSYFSPKLKCYLHFICYLPVCVNRSRSRL